MIEIIPFAYQDSEVRTLTLDGDPWFVLSDVLNALGISRRPAAVIERLDDDVRQTYPIQDRFGRTQNAHLVNESGLYDVIIRSDSPTAKPFRRWVTHEVLPSIRKTGQYSAITFDKQIPKTLPEALHAYAREIEAREALEAYAREIEPKAEAYDHFLSGDGTYSVGAAAKILGLSQNKLFAELRNAGILIAKGHMRNTPYQQYMHHFQVKAYDYTRTDGTVGTSYTTTVQPSGLAFIERKLGMTPTPEVI